MKRAVAIVAVLLLAGFALLWALGWGWMGERYPLGEITQVPIPEAVIAQRRAAAERAAREVGVAAPKQILFGDLHVHSTYSTDAYVMSLPLAGGDGARPVSHACDFARYCAALDFWSINDHAFSLTPLRWRETIDAIRQCNAVAGDPESPDVAAFLGWEWTQVGVTPETHYGHKNVVLRHLDAERIPLRPVSAGLPGGTRREDQPGAVQRGLLGLLGGKQGRDAARYFADMLAVEPCESGVPVRELPDDCLEIAETPAELFARLDDWGHEALVIPPRTPWGFYTPPGSSWDKQLAPGQHDPRRQRLIEVYSGHGNSEEFRAWREVAAGGDGEPICPAPRGDYLPSCWRAGEIIRERCLAAQETQAECEERATEARRNYLGAGISGHLTVPGSRARDWGDAGQCRDCFLPAFNYRPRGSAQYILALSRKPAPQAAPFRFRFGFIASTDNHSGRPGTGYKEYGRAEMTEARFAGLIDTPIFRAEVGDPEPRSIARGYRPGRFIDVREVERQGSFFQTGGLVAAHAPGRSRDAVYGALSRREVYGTSGPRILLWFDLINAPGTRGAAAPMGSEVALGESPIFQVRAVGSFEQRPGCPDFASGALAAEELERLCLGECYHPSERRRQIDRIEVVRIRPQREPGEPIGALVEDPWRSFPCDEDATGCRVTFSDPEFAPAGRDAAYYVRALETPSPAVAADGVACLEEPIESDCLGPVQERAWSSPIFVDWAGSRTQEGSP